MRVTERKLVSIWRESNADGQATYAVRTRLQRPLETGSGGAEGGKGEVKDGSNYAGKR